MLSRVITLVLVAIAVSVTASAQDHLKPGETFCPECPAPNPKDVSAPKRVVVRRAPTLDLLTRVLRRLKRPTRPIFGVPLDFEHLEDFWLRPGGSALPGRSGETGG